MKTKTQHTLSIADKLMLGDIFHGEQYEHIVRCVNSHDELVEALKDALAWIEGDGDIDGVIYDKQSIYDQIKQALSKAEGK